MLEKKKIHTVEYAMLLFCLLVGKCQRTYTIKKKTMKMANSKSKKKKHKSHR